MPGLSARQLKFLAARLAARTDQEACEQVGISNAQVSNWKREEPEFAQRYTQMWEDGVALALDYTRRVLGRAADRMADGLNATGGENNDRPDHATRLAAAKLIFQTHGLLKDNKIVQGPNGGPVQVAIQASLSKLSEEDLAVLERLSKRLSSAEPGP